MIFVPAENDILTDKTYYPGTYHPGCTVSPDFKYNAYFEP